MTKTTSKILPIAILILAFMLVNNIQAQDSTKVKYTISLGYGLMNNKIIETAIVKPNSNYYNQKHIGTVYFKYEYLISENIGLGINLAYLRCDIINDYTVLEYNKYSDIHSLIDYKEQLVFQAYSVNLRLNHLVVNNENFILYMGYSIGYRGVYKTYNDSNSSIYNDNTQVAIINKIKTDKIGNVHTNLGFELSTGFRHIIVNDFGYYVELGIAKSYMQFGVFKKF